MEEKPVSQEAEEAPDKEDGNEEFSEVKLNDLSKSSQRPLQLSILQQLRSDDSLQSPEKKIKRVRFSEHNDEFIFTKDDVISETEDDSSIMSYDEDYISSEEGADFNEPSDRTEITSARPPEM